MEKVILASNNQGKILELQALLSNLYTLVAQEQMNVTEVAETGLSFVENALIKARNAAKQSSLAAIADDSGLCVDALHGEPGIYSARYANQGDDNANSQKILEKMKNVADGKRGAHFCCALVFIKREDDPTPIIIQRNWAGEILREKVGDNGFGYDPIFYLPAKNCSAAQLSLSQKNKISHRAQALKALINALQKQKK